MNLLRKYYTKLTRKLPPWEAASNICVPRTDGLSPDEFLRLAAAEASDDWTEIPAGECIAHGGCILCRLEALEDRLEKPE